jgi:hypothetical protein
MDQKEWAKDVTLEKIQQQLRDKPSEFPAIQEAHLTPGDVFAMVEKWEDFTTLNNKRIELIERKYTGGEKLTEEEEKYFKLLQEIAGIAVFSLPGPDLNFMRGNSSGYGRS